VAGVVTHRDASDFTDCSTSGSPRSWARRRTLVAYEPRRPIRPTTPTRVAARIIGACAPGAYAKTFWQRVNNHNHLLRSCSATRDVRRTGTPSLRMTPDNVTACAEDLRQRGHNTAQSVASTCSAPATWRGPEHNVCGCTPDNARMLGQKLRHLTTTRPIRRLRHGSVPLVRAPDSTSAGVSRQLDRCAGKPAAQLRTIRPHGSCGTCSAPNTWRRGYWRTSDSQAAIRRLRLWQGQDRLATMGNTLCVALRQSART